jgi:hypothetical protein
MRTSKKTIAFVTTIILSLSWAMAQDVYFSYDDAGNRKYRGPAKIASQRSGLLNDTTQYAWEQPKNEVGEETMGQNKITIYPNPTRGELRVIIEGDYDFNKSYLFVYDLAGTVLISRSNISSTEAVDLTKYSMGTYVLKIILDDKKFEWKIIKD